MTTAEQLPNVLIAITPYIGTVGKIGTKVASASAKVSTRLSSALLKRGGSIQAWSAPTIYGLSSAGQQRMSIESREERGLIAREALVKLEQAYANKEISYDSFVDSKIELEKTIAHGEIGSINKWGSILTTGIIEGTITRYLGTAPNSKALVKAFANPTSNVAGALLEVTGKLRVTHYGKQLGELEWKL